MDLHTVDAALQSWIDQDRLPGVSYAIVRGGDVVARRCLGWADHEARIPLREDHLFRVFSNTKLVTSIAALQLLEQGRFDPDDPVGAYIPELADLRALRRGATRLDDTEPAQPVRVRHLLTHTAGFTYAFTDPNAPLGRAYAAAGMGAPTQDLAQQMQALGRLPLLFQPGAAWNYSVATDVVGRLVEVLAGERLDAYFRRHVFEALGLRDTTFFVPPEASDRLVQLYVGDAADPMRPGLRPVEGHGDAFRTPVPRLNPGGGLVSSLGDFTTLVTALLRGGAPLLRPETMRLVLQNQLPAGQWMGWPPERGSGHSFAASVRVEAPAPDSPLGEVHWGGLAGTKWCLWPNEDVALVLMTQRYMGFDLPYWSEFKQHVAAALR
jgi:CubicO group peptidase (beta-lactamase class C family)